MRIRQVPAAMRADFRASRLCATALLTSAVVLASLAPAMAWPPDSYSWSDDMVFEPDAPPPPKQQPVRHRRPKATHVRPKEAAAPTRKPRNPLIVAVSIRHQSLKVYDADGLFAESPVSTGMPGHATPLGIFSVIQKNKWHRSNIYSGAPMPYMQRLTWSGVAMHAGVLPGYPASHGCIRMPNQFATEMWSWTRMGARVVVTSDEISPVAIAHPLLATRKPEPAPPPAPEVKNDAATTAIAVDLNDLRPSLTPVVATVTEPVTTGLASSDAAAAPAAGDAAAPAVTAAPPAPKRSGPIAVFISGKDARLYVRQNFAPLFDVPITVAPGDRPLGTHLFTAQAEPGDAGTFRWSALSFPVEAKPHVASHQSARRRRDIDALETVAAPVANSATEALDRLTIPAETMTRLAEALTSGISIIVSDRALDRNETGLGTDFIVPLR